MALQFWSVCLLRVLGLRVVRFNAARPASAFVVLSLACAAMFFTATVRAQPADNDGSPMHTASPATSGSNIDQLLFHDDAIAGSHYLAYTTKAPPYHHAGPGAERFYDPYAYEVRAGFQVEARESNEHGTVDVGGDLVFPRFFTLTGLPDYLTPRFQIGGMINTAGRTDFVHTDMLWTYNFTERFFTDFFFGATIHDGHLEHDSDKFNALGCRLLFHVGGDFGYRFTPHWSAMVLLDHSSSGNGLTGCPDNQSLNQVGLKVGYRF